MALHRDIFWLGRQWAVTGFGMQAINQKHGGEFDIPIERLWDDNLLDAVCGEKWFNPDDFNKGLEFARARHPRPPGRPEPPPLPVEVLLQKSGPIAPVEAAPSPGTATIQPPESAAPAPKSAPSFPVMRIVGHPARLLRVWRMRQQHRR